MDPEGAPSLDLDAEIDRLYATAPGGFVGARDDLARRLRAAGCRDDAAAVKRLRRPTVAAWALNQLPRRAGNDVRRLVRHAEELRRLQDELLAGGDRDRLRAVARDRRAAIARLTDAALQVLAEDARTGVEGHRDEVVATLEAASLEPEAGAVLLEGRLATALAPSPGFGLPGAPSADPPPPPRAATPAADQADDVGDRARAARLAEARQVATDAAALAVRRRAEVAALGDEAVSARRAVHLAEEEVARLTGELERARRAADEAGRQARTAAARAADGERAAAAADAQARAAGEALARLEAG